MMKTVAVKIMSFVFFVGIAGCTKTQPPQSQQTTHNHETGKTEPEKAEEYYTCPMHPSVRSDRPGACPVCNMALVKKTKQKDIDMKDTASLQSVSLSPTQRIIANVSTVKTERKNVSRDIQAVGVVSYAEPNYRHISMRFPGRLDKLYLTYTGQTVRKGDRVADVYSPEAISAQQEYLLSLDSYEQATRGEQTFAATAGEMLEQSKNKLLQWGFTQTQVAGLKERRKVNSLVTIYSQVSGTVVKKSVDPQHYAATGEDMFDVADLSTVWIYLDMYEKDIRFIKPGQIAQVSMESYPSEKFSGSVIFIDPVVNPETRTIRVRTEFANRQSKLKPNSYVTATIAVPKTRALVVPSSAIVSTGKRTLVWVEVKANVYEPRDVKVSSSNEGFTVVLDGLQEGENVVETGGFLIDSESQLGQTSSEHKH